MDNVGVYTTAKYTAYIYPKKIIICTNMQCFRISYEQYQNQVYLDSLKLGILSGEIDSIYDFNTMGGRLKWNHCSTRPVC